MSEYQQNEKPLSGLWRKNPQTPEGKYLVKRRDGSIIEWPNFVIGAKDPAAPAALRAYAVEAERLGMNATYIADILWLASEFEHYRALIEEDIAKTTKPLLPKCAGGEVHERRERNSDD